MAGKSLNKVQLIGHVGKDPELRSTSAGQMVATFSIATNESYKPAGSEEWQEKTEWHNIVAWGRLAEIAAEYATKGKQIYLEGRLQTRSWEKDGEKRYTTEVVANEIILLGGRGESSGGRPPHPAEQAAPVMTGKPQPTKSMAQVDAEIDRMGANDVAKQFGGTVQPPSDDIPF